jgi:hypothetical protein
MPTDSRLFFINVRKQIAQPSAPASSQEIYAVGGLLPWLFVDDACDKVAICSNTSTR